MGYQYEATRSISTPPGWDTSMKGLGVFLLPSGWDTSMKRLGVFLLPPGWDTSPSQVTSQHFVRLSPKQFAGSHLYTWVERGTGIVKCLA